MEEVFAFVVAGLLSTLMLVSVVVGIWRLVLARRIARELQEQRKTLHKLEATQNRHHESLVKLINAKWTDDEESPAELPPPPVAFPAPDKVAQLYAAAAAKPPPEKPSQKEFRWEPPPNEFEDKALAAVKKIWTWIVFGDEYRKEGSSAEYAVGATWLLRVGIVMSVLAVGYFLKYSIDNHYLGPWAKVSLSLGAGAGMLLLGLKLVGKRYHLIAQGLLGGGVAALYLGFFAAYGWYHLVDPPVAFALMILVTVVAGAVAVGRDSALVAILGIIGGYCTPALLDTHAKNYPGLYSYMLLLGLGVLGVAWRKDWKLLNLLSFVFTYALFSASLTKYDAAVDFPLALGFLAAFFVLFAAVPILFNLVNRQKSSVLELLATLANLAVFFGLGHHLIVRSHDSRWAAVLSVALAAFYLAQLLAFLNLKLKDKGLLLTLSAMTAFCLAITFPLLLSGVWITASWAALGCVFLWLALRLEGKLLSPLAYVVYALAFARLLFCDSDHWLDHAVYWDGALDRLLSFGAFTAAMGVGRLLLKRRGDGTRAATFFGAAALGLLFVYLTLELNTLLACKLPAFRAGGVSILWGGFALALIGAGIARRLGALRYAGLALFLVTTLKVFFVDLQRSPTLWRIVALLALGLVTLAGSFIYIRFKEKLSTPESKHED